MFQNILITQPNFFNSRLVYDMFELPYKLKYNQVDVSNNFRSNSIFIDIISKK